MPTTSTTPQLSWGNKEFFCVPKDANLPCVASLKPVADSRPMGSAHPQKYYPRQRMGADFNPGTGAENQRIGAANFPSDNPLPL